MYTNKTKQFIHTSHGQAGVAIPVSTSTKNSVAQKWNWEKITVLEYWRYRFCIKFDEYLICIFVISSKVIGYFEYIGKFYFEGS